MRLGMLVHCLRRLPYHLLGRNKWQALGLEYPLEGVQTPHLDSVSINSGHRMWLPVLNQPTTCSLIAFALAHCSPVVAYKVCLSAPCHQHNASAHVASPCRVAWTAHEVHKGECQAIAHVPVCFLPPSLQVLSVVERLEAAGLNVICDAKRQAADREKHLLQGNHHHDFVPA